MSHVNPFLKAYAEVQLMGNVVAPHGEPILEVENARLVFQPTDSPISSFDARKLNLTYCKREWMWYLRGDRFDDTIQQYATMWKKLKQADGGFNSNYGQYLFGENNQFHYALRTLQLDKDSRRAAMVLLNQSHLYPENSDIVCTYSISFRIRMDKLNMTVNMRSNDLIFGTTNDVFCFSQLHNLALVLLQKTYPNLQLGVYTHNVDSLHVYQRHWDMLEDLVDQGTAGYSPIAIPPMTIDDAAWMMSADYDPNAELSYVRWLVA